MSEVKLVFELDRCWGCRNCEAACAIEKAWGPDRPALHIESVRGKNLPSAPQGLAFVPVLCQQCTTPACLEACPVEAIQKSAEGIVAIILDACTSCGSCESACPYGAISISPESGMPEKCDLCNERLDSGRLPACVQHCPGKVIHVETSAISEKASWSTGSVVYKART